MVVKKLPIVNKYSNKFKIMCAEEHINKSTLLQFYSLVHKCFIKLDKRGLVSNTGCMPKTQSNTQKFWLYPFFLNEEIIGKFNDSEQKHFS